MQRPDLEPGCYIVTFVQGKTDISGAGQSLILQKSGGHAASFVEWFLNTTRRPHDSVFQGLTNNNYNQYLKSKLQVTTRFVRHSTLDWVAQAMGRHRSIQSTRGYTSRATWGPTALTKSVGENLRL
eukprot:TRINITY_DN23773_c0_g1_i1.p3 TRINITY_DN23773_c0_g1~~TRINITY_DN23773_c0_g1_i1.p3  ORF type:complete len:126 (+),score=4.95 TRINITY_DN23773_c0_g1_i1:482-859(+)